MFILCFLLSFPTAPILVKVTAKILTVVAASQLSLPQSKPLWSQFANLILLFLCLKLSQGSPLLTGQSLTSLGWQTRPFRSWPSFFPDALGPSIQLFREGSGWLGLVFSGVWTWPMLWNSPLLLYEVHCPSPLTSPSYCVPFLGPFRLLLSRTAFFFVVQQRLLSAGCKVPKAKD